MEGQDGQLQVGAIVVLKLIPGGESSSSNTKPLDLTDAICMEMGYSYSTIVVSPAVGCPGARHLLHSYNSGTCILQFWDRWL